MRTTVVAMLAVLVLTAFTGHVQGAEPLRTEPYPVELQVGEVFPICKTGEVICPVSVPLCDNVKVVDFVDTPDGLAFKGISPGETLCSVMSVNKFRRVFRVTVR